MLANRSALRCSRLVVLACLCVWVSFIETACTQVQVDTVTTFGTGVAQVRQQAILALNDANKLSRDVAVQSILASPDVGLSESRLLPAISPDDINKWDNAFAGIATYVSALQSLLSTDQATNFGDTAVALGTELKQGQANTNLPAGVATAFTQIGEILIEAKQQHDALAAMQAADPGVRAVFTSMAKAIGQDPRGKTSAQIQGSNTGVMGTVFTNWQTEMDDGPIHDFAHASDAAHRDDNARKAALTLYLNMLDRRDAQLDALLSLRQSLLSLADAHSAAARGSKVDAAGAISIVSAQLDETKKLFDKFNTIPKEAQ